MNTKNLPVIPMILTGAGACLTAKNWQETGVTALSCSLSALLFKPGLAMLNQIQNLPKYLGWFGTWVLNAQMPNANSDGSYTLYSPYDGSRLILLPETIHELIQHLKPSYTILPNELAKQEADLPFIESNEPSEDAYNGIVYTREGSININDKQMEMQFLAIDNNCTCTTCKAFTRAYLHHLLANTPLLAQRLLIMHNVYWLNNNEKI